MNLEIPSQTIEFASLFLAAIDFSLALYVLMLNFRGLANRYVSLLLFLATLGSVGAGLLVGASSLREARVPTILLAAAIPAVQPAIVLASVAVLKPGWMDPARRWKWLFRFLFLLLLLYPALTIVDLRSGAGLYFTGLDPQTYAGGFVQASAYSGGTLAPYLSLFTFQILSLLTLLPPLYVALFDKKASRLNRRLAWLLLIQQLFVVVIQLAFRDRLPPAVPELLALIVFALTYTAAIFSQSITERRVQVGRLRPRLAALTLVVAVPLLLVVPLLIEIQTAEKIEQDAMDHLATANQALKDNVALWLEMNLQVLQQMVNLPAITSMDPQQQEPVLVATGTAFPHMYLVSTTDLTGMNLARNDGVDATDYSDREWFQRASRGQALTLQTLLGRTSLQPALVASMPIKDENGAVLGVGMFASTLTDISEELALAQIAETGLAYVVDAQNRLLAHPDAALFETDDLPDFSQEQPVQALRAGQRGLVSYTDDLGDSWFAHGDVLDNGWAVVVQQAESELLGVRRTFQMGGVVMVGAASLVLLVLTWLTIFQAVRPLDSLTRAARAVAAGDLEVTAPVESEDEIGLLARTFNSMTAQLRDLIGGLEARVEERTQALAATAQDLQLRSAELEASNRRMGEVNRLLEESVSQSQRRAVLLHASNEVSHAASQVRELDRLLPQVTELISQHFGYYHAGIFTIDESRRFAVLAASNSQGGQRMLARGHRLGVGSQGIVGYVAESGRPRIALDVGADAIHFDNPDLPATRSEMAVPLRSGAEIIGVLDVQSVEPEAFSSEDVIVLSALADQIAGAIENARLFEQAQRAQAQAEAAQQRYVQQEWSRYVRDQKAVSVFEYTLTGVPPVGDAPLPEMDLAMVKKEVVTLDRDAHPLAQTALAAPIIFRDQVIGALGLHTDEGGRAWTPDELALVQDVAEQIGLALENARLFEQTSRRARREALIGQIVGRVRQQPDIDSIMQTAVRELGKALGTPRTFVRLASSLEQAGAAAGTLGANQEVSDDGN